MTDSIKIEFNLSHDRKQTKSGAKCAGRGAVHLESLELTTTYAYIEGMLSVGCLQLLHVRLCQAAWSAKDALHGLLFLLCSCNADTDTSCQVWLQAL